MAAPRAYDWGQGNPLVIRSVFEKTSGGAAKGRWARDNQGWFSKLIGRDPRIETKVILSEEYLVKDSPAVADRGENGEPVVKVGQSALDAAQTEGEMSFLLGHELHHTIVRARRHACLQKGLEGAGGDRARFRSSRELRQYRWDLEKEADGWGQRYAFDAGYNPFDAVQAIRHLSDLGEALGPGLLVDSEHDSAANRESYLKSWSSSREPFTAPCPWSEAL